MAEMNDKEVQEYLMDLPDEVLSHLKFSSPWQYNESENGYADPDSDGAHISNNSVGKEDSQYTRDMLQSECWDKFNKNPQVNTSVRGMIGRLTGRGFGSDSSVLEIQNEIEELELDPRNRLYKYWPQYLGRSFVEGELFLILTCHTNGFIEVDFTDPGTVKDKGDDNSGIIFHPRKSTMPLIYNIENGGLSQNEQIPSIFIARYPELILEAKKHKDFSPQALKNSKSRKKKFRQFGGFYRFMVAFDKGFVTKRAISYLRTVLQWLNHYENLKKYEIDHKKASGAYVHVFSIKDPRTFKLWLGLSDTDRKKTAMVAKKTPGGSLVLPPGVEHEIKSPQLPAISGQDSDILHMITSGLNEPIDITTGQSQGPFASVKASRGPMSDRIADEAAYFERFLIHDFWGGVFFLKHKIKGFPSHFSIKEAVDFDQKKNPIFKKIKKRPEMLINISFPVSEASDSESTARALLGVKHGPVAESVGVSNEVVARRLGFGGNYKQMRLKKATEDENLPELV
ncbi:hypothetical protein HQ584_07620, partial [Patescibacteria group bacterium]|nr:hypothetical protein [Patescibacteria group bacterium]